MNDTEDLVGQITAKLEAFRQLEASDVEVHVDSTPQGQFMISLETTDRNVHVLHGWGEEQWSYDNPGVISVLLSDSSDQSSYSIEMTECELQDFPDLLENAQKVAKLFLGGKFQVQKPGKFNIFGHTNLYFDDQSLVYKYAAKTKGFKS